MKKIGMIILLIGLGFYLTSCNGTGDRKNSRTINLGYVNWAEGVAMAHVAKVILEEKGYKVNMMNTDAALCLLPWPKAVPIYFWKPGCR